MEIKNLCFAEEDEKKLLRKVKRLIDKILHETEELYKKEI